jgi:hypothetical protein
MPTNFTSSNQICSSLKKILCLLDKVKAFCLGGEGHLFLEGCESDVRWGVSDWHFQGTEEGSRRFEVGYTDTCLNGHREWLDPCEWHIDVVNGELLRSKAGVNRRRNAA